METDIDETHESCRFKVCILCYRKGTRLLSEKDVTLVKEYVIDGYSLENDNLPAALCTTCQILLSKKGNGKDVKLSVVDDYDPKRPINLRSATKCDCKICKVARSDFNDSRKMKKKRGRPTTNSTEEQKQRVLKICATCFRIVYPGCTHDCTSSRKARVENLEDLVSSPSTSQVYASRVIDNSDGTLLTLSGKCKKLEKPAAAKQLYSSDDMLHIQKDLHLRYHI